MMDRVISSILSGSGGEYSLLVGYNTEENYSKIASMKTYKQGSPVQFQLSGKRT